LERPVAARVVGRVLLPAAPDDGDPGTGEDADGVLMVMAPGAGLLVEAARSGIDVAGVGGEVAHRVTQLLVRALPEHDGSHLAGLAGGRGYAGQAGQRIRGRESASGVTDLAQQSCGPNGPGAGQAGEDRTVGVGRELLGDAGGEGLDLDDNPRRTVADPHERPTTGPVRR
jgi:hypothetical protein